MDVKCLLLQTDLKAKTTGDWQNEESLPRSSGMREHKKQRTKAAKGCGDKPEASTGGGSGHYASGSSAVSDLVTVCGCRCRAHCLKGEVAARFRTEADSVRKRSWELVSIGCQLSVNLQMGVAGVDAAIAGGRMTMAYTRITLRDSFDNRLVGCVEAIAASCSSR